MFSIFSLTWLLFCLQMMITGGSLSDSKKALALAQSHGSYHLLTPKVFARCVTWFVIFQTDCSAQLDATQLVAVNLRKVVILTRT